jgi:hypothetical protein
MSVANVVEDSSSLIYFYKRIDFHDNRVAVNALPLGVRRGLTLPQPSR